MAPTAPFDDRTIVMAVPGCPATYERRPAANTDSALNRPSVPRANRAVSASMPQGSTAHARRFSDYTVLQQHVMFWDRDGDGVIYPPDTYVGFRELGFNVVFSLFCTFLINFYLSYPTRLARSYLPDPFFGVYVGSIHKAKHGSDSGVYDTEGRFVPQRFEDLFAKWDRDGRDALTLGQLFDLMHANRCAMDPFGWLASFFEFGTTWLLVQRDGRVAKEDLRQVYDGSIFWRIRQDRQSKKGWDQGFGIGDDGLSGGNTVTDA